MATWTLERVTEKIEAFGFTSDEKGALDVLLQNENWALYFGGDGDVRIKSRLKTLLLKAGFGAMQVGAALPTDNSKTLCNQLVGAATSMPVPSFSDLEAVVNKQEPLAVKLPVTPQLYAEWHAADSSLCDHIESTAVGSGPAPARLLSHVSSWLGCVDNDCAGEAGLHARLDILIRYTWGMLGDSVGITAKFSRDKADASSATVTLKRPDLTAHLKNALVLKGEEKELEEDLGMATSELLFKSDFSWSALNFGSLPYIICYAAAGHKLQWYVQQCSNGHLTQLHPTPFNLQTRTGRMHALLASVHCFKAVLSMWKVLPQSLALPLFKPLTRAHGTSVEAKEEGVVKLIKNFEGNYVQQLQLTSWEFVQKAYRIAQEPDAAGLVVPVKLPSLNDKDTYMVVTQPGFPVRPTSQKELLEAVTWVLHALGHLHKAKLVHRDVRWENVVHAGPGARSSWVLLDLETVWAAGEAPPSAVQLGTCTPESLVEGCFEAASDIRLVAGLMASAHLAESGPAQARFMQNLRNARGVVASDVLTWDSFARWREEVGAESPAGS